ncbi:MAG TPA: ABC transporter ATP-binding protein [Anaerolineales bacterium]|nr:ABC transporter ATP-binding protein [Anaerolineales bacterium]
MTEAIIVQEVSKRYRMYHANRPRTLQETFLGNWRALRPTDMFLALDRISFQSSKGKMVGIIGENGAGKSTLLKLIGGVSQPDSGVITVNGKVGALLDLGVGFHPELTGRENIYVNGVVSGLTRHEIEHRFDEILHFSELENFIDRPIRTYSNGMKMRLAFSVAIHIEPEILLIDEVLAVGDIRFQAKCLERITNYKSEGRTILFVSHNHTQVKELCDEALWLRAGKLAAQGPATVVVDQYVNEMRPETLNGTRNIYSGDIDLELNKNRFGSQEVEITGFQMVSPDGTPVSEISSGEPLWVEIEYAAKQTIQAPIFGASIADQDGRICFESSTDAVVDVPQSLDGAGKVLLKIDRLELVGGQYYIDIGIYQAEWAYAYDYHWHVYTLTVLPTQGSKGVLYPPHEWEFRG